MDDMILSIGEWAITGLLTIIGTALWRQLRDWRKRDEQRDRERAIEDAALKRGMQMVLRGDLINSHRIWLGTKGYMPVEIKDSWLDMYKAYEALGSNGIIEGLYKDVVESHVAPDPKEQKGED